MFDNPELDEFKPEIIFIHTSFRNITELPVISDDAAAISDKLDRQYAAFPCNVGKAVQQIRKRS